MSTVWSVYSFDYARFEKGAFDPHIGVSKLRNFLSGPDSTCPDRKLLTKEIRETLTKGNFDYNTLPKKQWKYLDAYVRLYIKDVMTSEAESETPGSADNWQKLLRFYLDRNGKDSTVFSALAEDGRRYNLNTDKPAWYSGITDFLYKKPAKYLILEGDELDRFCRHLQVLFYVNSWDWPTYLPAQELLKPIMLEPFLTARDKGQAVFVVRDEKASVTKPRPVEKVAVEVELTRGK
ncbi:MAG: hypothetical protein WA952_06980, partial [Lewinella sp.]